MSTALAIRRDEDIWTKERIETIKKSICPQGISDADFELFVEQCRRSGLDPFKKEAFCVPRRVNVGSKESPKWITRHEMQAAEAGMAARADRFPDFRGLRCAAICEGDEISIDEGEGKVHHKYTPGKRGKLIGAWAQPFRENRTLPIILLKLDEYVQDNAMWRSKPVTMIVKCARAAAYRVAYPNVFGGIYIREEMPSDGAEVREPQQLQVKAEPKQLPKGDSRLKEALKSKVKVIDVQPGQTEEEAERMFLGEEPPPLMDSDSPVPF